MIFTKSKNTYFATPKDNPKDKISLEVGDSKQPDFKPQQKIMRWDNEVNVSLRLVHDELTPTVSKSREKITWEGKKVKAEIYPLTEDEGGQEFEITLKEKPKSNVVQFTLVDKGVEYFYQPFLKNTNPDGSFWEEREGGGRSECPANVGGSYAIYASENKINYVGGKEYKCGKVGHIFRPRIEDTNGDWVWGDLNIKDGILSVTIPQEFLDKAVYPVRHAAGLTFGYTTAGASNTDLDGGSSLYRVGSPYTIGENGTVNSVTAYLRNSYNRTLDLKCHINSLNSGGVGTHNQVASAERTSVQLLNAKSWITVNFNNESLVENTSYLMSMMCTNTDGYTMIFYDWNKGTYYSELQTYSTPENPWVRSVSGSYGCSIYATYTAGGSSGPANLKSLNTNLKANIKSINGNLIANVKSLNTNV